MGRILSALKLEKGMDNSKIAPLNIGRPNKLF